MPVRHIPLLFFLSVLIVYHSPVIGDRERCLQAGMVSYINMYPVYLF